MFTQRFCIFFILCILLTINISKVDAITEVDTELQLLLDVSASVDSFEYQMQLQGYANAFSSEEIQSTILDGTLGKIAVQLIMWSGQNQQQVMVDWVLLDTKSSLDDFSNLILEISRPFSGWTAVGSALDYAYQDMLNNEYEGLRKVIDVSGDGVSNAGIDAQIVGINAINAGVDSINGIVITESQYVIDYYQESVVQGDGSFLLSTSDYLAFESAIANKINAELKGELPPGAIVVIPIPEPSSFGLVLFSFLTALFIKRS